MAKFSLYSKLTKKESEDLILRFCQALTQIKKPEEAAKFVTDLLSKSEAEMLAKRLKIAELLLEGHTYQDIRDELKVSQLTIARVSEWLKMQGEGYRLIVARTKKLSEIKPIKPSLSGLKRMYPQYYWPEILLQEIVYTASKRQRQKLQKILDTLGTKTKLHKQLSRLIKARQ